MTERGFTLLELLVVVAVVGAVAAIAVPSMLRARISANETSAIATMRAINSAQASYSASAASGTFATSLATLGTACPSSTTAFLSAELAADPAVKSGYRFRLQAASGAAPGPDDCNGTGTHDAYYSTARPVDIGITGNRAFASNGAGTIYFDVTGVPPSEGVMVPGGGSVIQ